MQVTYAPNQDREPFDALMADRSGFQRAFCQWILSEPSSAERVLDIGCGRGLPEPLSVFKTRFGELDGVDPDPGIADHPLLGRRWNGRFEDSDIPENAYDLAYAYNVLEHIEDPSPFFGKLQRILKPGGVFWAVTPHSRHPFCILARSVELAGGKGRVREWLRRRDGAYTVNRFASYYRANRAGAILRAVRGLGFSKAAFHYLPCLQWDTYFPVALRWLPHTYDYLLGCRIRSFMLILAVRLEK